MKSGKLRTFYLFFRGDDNGCGDEWQGSTALLAFHHVSAWLHRPWRQYISAHRRAPAEPFYPSAEPRSSLAVGVATPPASREARAGCIGAAARCTADGRGQSPSAGRCRVMGGYCRPGTRVVSGGHRRLTSLF